MLKSGEEILADIDTTLDQLIHNAEAIRNVAPDTIYANEIEALQKTQESLLARVIHMNQLLEQEKTNVKSKKKENQFVEIQQKIVHFGKLNARLINDVASKFKAHKAYKKIKPMKVKTVY